MIAIQGGGDEDVLGRTSGAFEVAAVSVRDPQKDVCQDAALVVDLGPMGLVACAIDGMGGMMHGREAARVAMEAFEQRLRVISPDESCRDAIVESFERAHEEVRSRCPGGGATVVCAIVTEAWIQTLHAGDAEALVVDQRGELRYRTTAHSPVGYAMNAGLLGEEDALVHAERHLVSNGLGVEGMAVHVGPRIPFGENDTLVVMTDGVTDNAREAEIVEALRRGKLLRVTEELLGLCRDRMMQSMVDVSEERTIGKPDDLTLITVRRATDPM